MDKYFILQLAGMGLFELALMVGLKDPNLSWGLKIFAFVFVNAIALLALEVLFRIVYHRIKGRPYSFIPKIKYKQIYVEPHPHISIVYKKNCSSQKPMKAIYPLNQDKNYYVDTLTSNNFRHYDGPAGNRPIQMPKPKGQFRILCLGDSTTGNYLWHNGTAYSYPLELERYLQKTYPGKDIVVHNCGQGGWTSADVLINFLLKLYDTQPDLIMLYSAYNDIAPSLTPGFESDYSHAKRNLGETYHLYRLAGMLPDIPSSIYNMLFTKFFPYINPRYGSVEATTRGTPDLKGSFEGLSTYRRNIEHLVKACQASGIQIVLCTYVHYLHKIIQESENRIKFRDGLILENQELRELAIQYNIPLVDSFNLIPQEEKYFVDCLHFTPLGMALLAEHIGKVISPMIQRHSNRKLTESIQ
jgi:lysophospholipase L1-like esterase